MIGQEFIGRARALVPAVRTRARQAEQLRRLPEETFREFQEAGLFRALQPARFGGFELDPSSSCREPVKERQRTRGQRTEEELKRLWVTEKLPGNAPVRIDMCESSVAIRITEGKRILNNE